ncbi:MAG: HlyD family efflux transporter periplasmic adaptor subunit [Opitutaceae bacterium]|nr:HlyD family efflux transporter periplasmic adaptor subunit [Opitutaceae bacterium]
MPSPSRKKRRRWIPWTLGLALIVALGLGLRPSPARVEVARVTTGPLQATVSEEGKTRIRQRYVISSPVNGQLRRVPFKPGAEITAGAILAVIEPMAASPLDARSRALAEARRDAAAAALDKARAAYQLAVTERTRVENMQREGTVSPQDLDTARLRETNAARDVVNAEGTLRSAEAELHVAASTASESPSSDGPAAPQAPLALTAPVAGRVLRVFQESERPVAAGTPILEVGDPTDLEVVVELLSRDGAALAPGAKVLFEQWGGDKPLEGRVRLVEPAAFTKISALGVEEQRVYVVADITTPLAERASLGDNFRVEARVVVWETERTLKVPTSGLFRQGSSWAALVLRDGRAELVPVEAGRSSGTEMQVLSGLAEGDEVILYPGDRIKPGQRVQRMDV